MDTMKVWECFRHGTGSDLFKEQPYIVHLWVELFVGQCLYKNKLKTREGSNLESSLEFKTQLQNIVHFCVASGTGNRCI